ncbi:MAG: DNA primase large subunit PriL [Candidatus Bathyarchaeota archaeon]|nr:DNA primase large subunit PriL [Candidatus Bathyarchaeota archaeon]
MSEREAAKYPFIQAGVKLVEGLNLQLDDLTDPNYRKVLDRAAERVTEAIIQGEVSAKLAEPLTELLSYPIAVMYVTLIGEQFLSRRFALAEAVRSYNLLQQEYEDKIMQIAEDEFSWNIVKDPEYIDGTQHNLKLRFSDYLRSASGFHEPKWKLVNRKMEDGFVSLTGIEAARLIQVEVDNWVKERVSTPSKFSLPQEIQSRVDAVRKVFEENRSKLGGSRLPEEIINEAFPPCMIYCLEGLLSGRRASHMERFGLTSFLVNIGMPIDQMVSFYTDVTDFDESLTRYQIEHIAGLKGNRTRYTPPTCATLRTHGICRNMDSICKTVSHPLSYYRKKAWRIQRREKEKAKETQAETSNTTKQE